MQKRILIIIGIIILAAVIIGGAFAYQYFLKPQTPMTNVQSNPNVQNSNTQTAGWKTYVNAQYNYQVQYPSDAKIFDLQSQGNIENSNDIEITPKDSSIFLSISTNKYDECPQQRYNYTQVTINNMKFFKADVSTEYRGMNSRNDIAISYCTLNNAGVVYTLTVRDAFEPTDTLLKIMNTFKFTK